MSEEKKVVPKHLCCCPFIPCQCRWCVVCGAVTYGFCAHKAKTITSITITHVASTPHGLELGGRINNSERLVPHMTQEQNTSIVKTEHDIEKAMEMIVALTRNLLSLSDEMEVDVHVRPQNRQFVVTVEVAGFVLQQKDARMSIAIEAMLEVLSTRLHQRVTEAEAIIGWTRIK